MNTGSLDAAQVSVDPAVHRDGNALDSDNGKGSYVFLHFVLLCI